MISVTLGPKNSRSLKQKATCMQGWERKMLLHSPTFLLKVLCALTGESQTVFCHITMASQAVPCSWSNMRVDCLLPVCRTDKRRVALHTSELPYAQVPPQIHREVRIRGIVDVEIRRLTLRAPATIEIHR